MIKKYLILFFLAFTTFAYSQVSNVRLDNNVYDYLSRLSQKGIIQYEDLVKPLSRRYIASKLIEARERINKLTSLQKDELEFYEKEFGFEIQKQNSEGRRQISKEGSESKIENQEPRTQNQELRTQNQERRTQNQERRTQNQERRTQNQESGIQQQDTTQKRDLFDKSWEFEVLSPAEEEENERNGERLKGEWEKGRMGEREKENFTFFGKDPFDRYRMFSYRNNLTYLNVKPNLGYENGSWEGDSYGNLFLGLGFQGEIGDVIGFNFELKQTRQSPRVIKFYITDFSKNTSIDLTLADAERLEYASVNVDLGVSWDWGSFTVGKNFLNWGYGESGKIVLSEKAPSFPYIRLDLKPADWFRFNYIHAWLNSDVIDSNSFYSSLRYQEYGNTDRYTYISKFLAVQSVTFIPLGRD